MGDEIVEADKITNVLCSLLNDRHSCRRFENREVPLAVIERILDMAQKAPSWCNVQPWRVELVSGRSRDLLSEALTEAAKNGEKHPDFEPPAYLGVYRERRRESGLALYASVNIERSDRQRRIEQSLENFRFFGAPQVAIISTDRSLGTYGAVDCGGYVSMLLLAAQALGVATVPQAAIAMYPDVVRRQLGLGETERIVCAVAMGYEDETHPVNSFRTTREDLAHVVRWRK